MIKTKDASTHLSVIPRFTSPSPPTQVWSCCIGNWTEEEPQGAGQYSGHRVDEEEEREHAAY